MSVRELIQAVYRAYGERDLEGTRALVSEDFCWNAAIDPGEAPFGGSCLGPDAMLQRMSKLADTFDYLEVKPMELLVDGDRAAARVVMRLQSKTGGDPFELNCCHFWHVIDGKCTELTEVYDTGLMAKNMT